MFFTTTKGEKVLDFGQNIAGYVTVKAKGTAGQKIRLSHAEVLDKEGNVYTGNLRRARQVEDKYISKWKDKMQSIISELQNILTEDDFKNFKNAQDEWEKQLIDNAKADWNIVENNQYKIMSGSSFHHMWLSNIRGQYRKRTIHIQYMLYLIQGGY